MRQFLPLALLLCASSLGHSQWQRLPSPTTNNLLDVFFADSLNGWITSSGNDSATAGIFHTSDGGGTWALQHQSSWSSWLAGLGGPNCWAIDKKDTLLHTRDGGLHWQKISLLPLPGLDSAKALDYLYFYDTSRGWVSIDGWRAGQEFFPIYKTTNGGLSWTERDSGADFFEFPLIQFTDPLNGYLTGENNFLDATTDGGLSWNRLTFLRYEQSMDMQFVSNDMGWVSSGFGMTSTELAKTTDSGRDWTYGSLVFECSGFNTHLRFVDTLSGWVAAYSCGNGGRTEVWHTTNSGTNWTLQDSSAKFGPQRVYCVDSRHCWIVGDGGGIMRTSDGGTESVPLLESILPRRFHLEQNYPNPFNPTTMIRFEVPKRGEVSLRIFDVLGREVTTLFDGVRQPGIYSINWNGASFTSGVYYCRIQAGNFTDVKTLLLLK
jgi:photosystem II stability/assembly factor-like uncharacterized protein